MCPSSAMIVLIFNVIFLASLVTVSGQYLESPCPDVFSYQSDHTGVYGVISLRSSNYVPSLKLIANFSIAARLPSNNYGRIEPINNHPQILQEYNRGVPIQYRVDFPVTSPLPRVTAVSVNDNVICYGPADIPAPNQYVTSTSLQHTLFLKGGINPGFFDYEPSKPQQQDLEFFNQYPSDGQTQIFTFGEDGDRWNSITYPSNVERPRPQEQPPSPPPTRPPPQYYPEVTQQTRPPPQYYPEVTQQTRPPPQYYPEVVTQPPPPPPPRPPPQTTPVRQPDIANTNVECGIVSGGNERLPLIFNGQSYSRGDWPWLVAIYKRKEGSLTFICSGTLVSDRHVVTAAHCMRQRNAFSSNRDMVVKVGVYNLEDWGDDITVTRNLASANIHESYNATSLANDILVMTLERSVQFNTNIRPACLWSGNSDLSRIVGASGVVAGWGASESGPAGSGEPRVVRVPVVSTAMCRASRPDFHKLTSSTTLCAGDRNGSGPCLGDSGGGLYLLEGGRWRLRGVVSLSLRPESGDSTCNLNEYIVFTDSAKYLTWIQGIIRSY